MGIRNGHNSVRKRWLETGLINSFALVRVAKGGIYFQPTGERLSAMPRLRKKPLGFAVSVSTRIENAVAPPSRHGSRVDKETRRIAIRRVAKCAVFFRSLAKIRKPYAAAGGPSVHFYTQSA